MKKNTIESEKTTEKSDINSVVIKDLSFTYSKDSPPIFEDLNLEVGPGKFVCLLGPSGCGKSTLLKLLSGLEKPTSGEIYLGGILHRGPNLRKAVVFQDYNLFPWLSALDNVLLGVNQRFPDRSKKENEEYAKECLRQVELKDDVFDKLPKELSGGMQQRCGIARAYALDAPYLLMDEPFGALDAVTRSKLQDLTLKLWRESSPRTTVFFVTHDVDEALILAEKIVVLGQGGGGIIYDIELSEAQKGYEKTSKEYMDIRNTLVSVINQDVEENIVSHSAD